MDVETRKTPEPAAVDENIVAAKKDNSPLFGVPGSTWPVVHLLLIGFAVLVTYFGIWRAYFWTDDFWMLGWVRHQPSLADAVWAQFGYAVRFLLDAHLWLRMYLFEMDPAPYYMLGVGQHVLVGFLVYLLIRTATSRNGLALLAAILFATTYAHFTVVTWITGSEYSQAALFHLATLGAFAAYLETRRTGWLMASLTAFVALLLYCEVALSVPLVLIAYHLTLGRAGRPLRTLQAGEFLVHVPYLALFAVYLAVQTAFVFSGSSEARVAAVGYGPGWHMVSNLYYLAYLVVPPALPDELIRTWIGQWALDAASQGTLALAIVGNIGLAVLFWRGTPLVRFAVAFIYLTFLPYLFWEGAFAGALRYRYLPSMAFAGLVAMGVVRLHERLARRPVARGIVVALVALQLALNVAVVQTWVSRHVRHSDVRRAAVETLLARYPNPEPGSHIVFQVPNDRFRDLADACTLVYAAPMRCEAVVVPPGSAAGRLARDEHAILLQVSASASVRVGGSEMPTDRVELP